MLDISFSFKQKRNKNSLRRRIIHKLNLHEIEQLTINIPKRRMRLYSKIVPLRLKYIRARHLSLKYKQPNGHSLI